MVKHEEIKNYMSHLIAEAMYMDVAEVNDDELFSDFGLESVTLVKVVEKICEKYACTIQVEEILPHQTLSAASSYIYEKIAS